MRLYAEFAKVDSESDGTLEVSGIASSGSVDSAGETITPAAMKAALPDYLRFPTIREMHDLKAAGIAIAAETDDDGITRITAKVVDPIAITKIQAGVYRGFSIGGKVLKRDPKNRTIITAIRLTEISLVDRPCNPDAVLDAWKADGPTDKDHPMRDAATADKAADPIETPAEDAAKAAEAAAVAPPVDTAPIIEAATSEPATAPDALARAEASIAALEAAVPGETVEKGIYTLEVFADVLSSLAYIVQDAQDEAAYEGDNSPVPAKIKAAFLSLAGAFKEMAVEEINELIDRVSAQKAAKADKPAEGESIVVKLDLDTGEVKKALDTAADALKATEAERDTALTKLAERDESLVKFADRMDALAGRLAKLEATPLPPKTGGVLAKAVSKQDDATSGEHQAASGAETNDDQVEKALAEMSDDERTLLLTKVALRQPRIMNLRS